MSYATADRMIEIFGDKELLQLSNPENRLASAIDTNVLERALEDASSEMEAVLGRKLPDPVPAVMGRIACDIARYYLYSGRSTTEVETRYENALKLLGRIRKGEAGFGGDGISSLVGPKYKKPKSVFGENLFQ